MARKGFSRFTITCFSVALLASGLSYAPTANAYSSTELDALVTSIQSSISTLQTDLSPYSSLTQKPREIIATLEVGKMFLPWIQSDDAGNNSTLALSEARATDNILKQAIQDFNSGNYQLSAEKSVIDTHFANGVWANANSESVFLKGIQPSTQMVDLTTQGGFDTLKNLGINEVVLSIPSVANLFPDECTSDPCTPATASNNGAHPFYDDVINLAYQNNVVINFAWNYGKFPDWFFTDYPEAKVPNSLNHFFNQDPDHPRVQSLIQQNIQWFLNGLLTNNDLTKLKKTIMGFTMGNETTLSNISDYTMANWRTVLQAKYGTIAALNASWGSSYASFAAISPSDRATIWSYERGYADWAGFNSERFNGFFAWVQTTMNGYTQPSGITFNTHAKVQSERNFAYNDDFDYRDGLNRETFSAVTPIIGVDTRVTAGADTPDNKGVIPPTDDPNYSISWVTQSLAFDYFKSFAPLKPVNDTEWHSVDTTRYDNPNTPEGHIPAALRLATWHGLGAANIWEYTRPDAGNSDDFTANMLTAQPYVMNAFFKEAIKVDNDMDRSTAFQQASKDVRVLFSYNSGLHGRVYYLNDLKNMYQAFNFQDKSVGLATESMLEGDLSALAGVKLIILPSVQYLSQAALNGLKTLASNGVAIVIEGTAPQYDGDLQPLSNPTITGPLVTTMAHANNFAAYASQASGIMDAAGVSRPYRLVDSAGNHPQYVEGRFASYGGNTIGYAINLSKIPVTFKVQNSSANTIGVKPYKNGVTSTSAVSSITLMPREYIEFQVGGVASGDTQAPTAATLSSTGQTGTTASLSWTASTDNVGVTGYDIYQDRNTRPIASVSAATSSYTVSGLVPGTSYEFHIVARDSVGNESAASNAVTVSTTGGDTHAPTAPILSTPANTDTMASLSWTAASDNVGVTGYDVYQGSSSTPIASLSGTTMAYTVTGLTARTSYSFSVKAKDAAGNASALSNVLSVTTTKAAVADTQAPTAPTLSSTGQTASTASLSWTAATDDVGVTGYDIYVNGSSTAIATVSGATTSYTATGLTASTTYTFTVKAKDAAGNQSASSNSVSVTTSAGGDTQAPTAPTLSSAGKTDTTASLSWTASTDNVGVNGYEIYMNGSSTAIASVSGTTTSYTATGLAASTAYSFTVKAKDAAANYSAASNTVSVTTDAASSSGTTLLSDDFEDGNANGWSVQGGTWSVVTDGTTKAYYADNSSVTGRSYAGQSTWTDYAVSADAKVSTWNTNGQLGLIARYTDQNNFYRMYYSVSSGTVVIAKKVAGTDTTLVQSSVLTAPTTGAYHTYKLEVVGSTLNAYIDGVLAATATDSSLTSGYAGLINYKEQVHYDNIVVSDKAAPTAPVLSSTAHQVTTVNLSWTAATDNVGVTGYDVYQDSNPTPVASVSSATTSYTVTGLSAGTSYNFTVKAKDGAGNSSASSNSLTVKTSLLVDDFEDGNANGWSVQGGTWSVVTDGTTKAYYADNPTVTGRSYAGQNTWTNYTVSAAAKVSAWNTGGQLGLLARYTDQNNFYRMYYSVSSGTVVIARKVAGTETTLVQSSAITAPSTGTYHAYKLEVSGSTINAYIDGTLMATATDSSLSAGYGGLINFKEQVNYDNVLVE